MHLRFQYVLHLQNTNLEFELFYISIACGCIIHNLGSNIHKETSIHPCLSLTYLCVKAFIIILLLSDFFHNVYQLYSRAHGTFKTYVHFKHKYRRHWQVYVTNNSVLYLKSLTLQPFEISIVAVLHLHS